MTLTHTNGILGAVSLYDCEYRRVKLHKDNGFNAIRCAHNPPSRDFLEACDRLGVMAVNEAFDMFRMTGNPNDYHAYFQTHRKYDIEQLITRDRNHPCIVLWSALLEELINYYLDTIDVPLTKLLKHAKDNGFYTPYKPNSRIIIE